MVGLSPSFPSTDIHYWKKKNGGEEASKISNLGTPGITPISIQWVPKTSSTQKISSVQKKNSSDHSWADVFPLLSFRFVVKERQDPIEESPGVTDKSLKGSTKLKKLTSKLPDIGVYIHTYRYVYIQTFTYLYIYT